MTIIKQILHNKLSCCALLALLALYGMVLFAPFFAPYPYDGYDMLYTHVPPSRVHLFSIKEKVFRPFIYDQTYEVNEYYKRIYQEDKTKIHRLKFFVRGFEYKLFGLLKTDRHLFGVEGAKVYLLGGDLKGRDIFSRVVYGGRVSLSIGLIAAAISLIIGLLVGGLAGYFGGGLDNILMRICEMIMMVPGFYLMITLRSYFINKLLSSTHIYFLVVVILSFIGWAGTARIIRGMAISLRENEYVYAAKSLGLSHLKIIIRHILPHTFSYVIVVVFLSIPGYILGEAALSMLGLGIQEPEASWGNLLSQAMGIVNIRLYPWILTPGLFILLTVMCFNILGERLRDIFDPKRKVL